MAIDTNIINRLNDLHGRLSVVVGDPDERPLWLHWSDAVVISEAMEVIDALNLKLANIQNALGEAIKIV